MKSTKCFSPLLTAGVTTARVLTSVEYCLVFIGVLSQSFGSPTIPVQFTMSIMAGYSEHTFYTTAKNLNISNDILVVVWDMGQKVC